MKGALSAVVLSFVPRVRRVPPRPREIEEPVFDPPAPTTTATIDFGTEAPPEPRVTMKARAVMRYTVYLDGSDVFTSENEDTARQVFHGLRENL